MSTSNQDNISFFCAKHAPNAMGLKKVPKDIIGRHVKKAFPAIDPHGIEQLEHMWVKVQSVQGHTLFGVLGSEPVYDCGLSYEDPVQVDIEEVEEIIPPITTH